jgi:hypothetical protein
MFLMSKVRKQQSDVVNINKAVYRVRETRRMIVSEGAKLIYIKKKEREQS